MGPGSLHDGGEVGFLRKVYSLLFPRAYLSLFLLRAYEQKFSPKLSYGKPEDEMYDAIIRPRVPTLTYNISRGGDLEMKEKIISGKARASK